MTNLAAPDVLSDAMALHPYRVLSTHRETEDTVTLEFVPETDWAIEPSPGQFTMVYAFGVGEVPISVAGVDTSTGVITHTIRAVGAVTTALCALEIGDQTGLRGPYGIGWPMDAARGRDVVVAAGGIGLAPLRPVMHELVRDRSDFGAVSLIYGARTPDDILYTAELREWRSRFDFEIEVTVDRAQEGWYGDVGLVTNLLTRIGFDPANTSAMACGPEIMMKVVARDLGSRGVAPDRVAVSLERNMKCAIGFCGHCQYGPDFVCRNGPVVAYADVRDRMRLDEL